MTTERDLNEALETNREQVADLLELVEVERDKYRAMRAAIQEEIDSAYRVGANYVMCSRLGHLLRFPPVSDRA